MKSIAIIGAGNMGAGIARALAANTDLEITVSNPTEPKLKALKKDFPRINATTDNVAAASSAQALVLAVKPWILPGVINELASALPLGQKTVISLAGGVSLDDLDSMLAEAVPGAQLPPTMHVIPTTAVSIGRSMTFISARRTTPDQEAAISDVFALLGDVAVIEERLMPAATALSSCGIAYVYKYIQACVQAGVQLGFYPHQALRYVLSTIDGAVEMLRHNGTLPQQEIDRVTTPGGLTIKGINQLEHDCFSSAVINAIIAPLKPQ